MTGIRNSEFIIRMQLGIIKELYKNNEITEAEYSYVYNKYNKKLEIFEKNKTDEPIYIDIMI